MEVLYDGIIEVDAFMAYLRDNGYPNLQVDRRPDNENRSSADIDAVAGQFAIEHTSIDTVSNQRRDSERFLKAAGDLEYEPATALPFRLEIILPYDAITTRQRWSRIRTAFKTWVLGDAQRLSDGYH